MLSRAGTLTCILFLYMIGTIGAMPSPPSTHSITPISLAPASHILQKLFDQLIAYDIIQARSVLDETLKSVYELSDHQRRLDTMMTRPVQVREAHINNCRNAEMFFRSGQNGSDILQTLMIDHLVLAALVRVERAFLFELMFSIYLYDVATPTEIPDIPWSDDAMASLLTDHAVDRRYIMWQAYLLGCYIYSNTN